MSRLRIPRIIKTDVCYDGFFKIAKERLHYPDGIEYDYYSLITKNNAAVVIGRTNNEEMIVLKEYRHPARMTVWGAAGGYLEENEDPVLGGKREFLEETGYDPKSMHILGTAYPYPGISGQTITYLLADQAKKKQEPVLEPAESLEVEVMPLNELLWRTQQEPVDGTLCTALYFFNLQNQPAAV